MKVRERNQVLSLGDHDGGGVTLRRPPRAGRVAVLVDKDRRHLLLVAGVLLWAVGAMPWIDGDIKQAVKILVIVVVAIWIIGLLAGLVSQPHFPALR